ncbi:hypothetical protein IC218_21180 [Clostridioides sp. ES-S-0005-03]|uniref:hypothetical protein n=1 Tax=unclassified Clostridioides TaxID=2635829 RepID=UPI001D0F81E4|nr:hypothetical protein [Clostridioides sp. ES-S-0173-01]MCC0682742.1 hypothetical protein [Clostridioides sp. ES-S-0005-03]MCC0697408.1 hypothetical protein [Clostridioides sp. ES-S-0048-02]UDN49596.1 hypothetical protein JJJ25_19840 [Clostridioides sp. ES-S-0173-01]
MTEADILEMTYVDKMTIIRKSKGWNQETCSNDFSNVVIAENVPCAISRKEEAIVSGDIGVIVVNRKLFCRPEVDIKAGDTINATYSHGEEAIFKVSMANIYPSHMEIPITELERI